MTEESETGKCYFCSKDLTKDNYCYGCKEFICENCDTETIPFGRHHPSEHKE